MYDHIGCIANHSTFFLISISIIYMCYLEYTDILTFCTSNTRIYHWTFFFLTSISIYSLEYTDILTFCISNTRLCSHTLYISTHILHIKYKNIFSHPIYSHILYIVHNITHRAAAPARRDAHATAQLVNSHIGGNRIHRYSHFLYILTSYTSNIGLRHQLEEMRMQQLNW